MHRSRLTGTVLAGLAALALVAAAPAPADSSSCRLIRGADTPEDTADDVEVCREDVWFHRAQTPVGNVDATVLEANPTFDTTEPQTSVTGGAGGAYASNSVADLAEPEGATHTITYEGTFTGNIDNLAVTQYVFLPAAPATDTHGMHLWLYVDNTSFPITEQAPADVRFTQVSRGLYRLDFAFTGIYDLMKAFQLDTDQDIEHTVQLKIASWYFGDEGTYVYDASEVPSGMVFNIEPDKLGGYTTIPVS